MIYDVKELKEYFDKRFNELKSSLYVCNKTLENFKSEMKSDLHKLEDKIDNKIKALESLEALAPWCSGYHYCTTSFYKA